MEQQSYDAQEGRINPSLGSKDAHPITYAGSATSHFQSEPLQYDPNGEVCLTSDWERELVRQLCGGPSGIPKATTTSLPRFLPLRHQYIDRSASLSENMFRFSIEFSRLCPKEGEFNQDLMKEYLKTLLLIRSRGQEPLITLHHFTMPKDLASIDNSGNIISGAWEHRDAIKRFKFYMDNVIRVLSDQKTIKEILNELRIDKEEQSKILAEGPVRYFLTINEPACMLYNGYLGGVFPPFKRIKIRSMLHVLDKLVEAHDVATTVLREGLRHQTSNPQIGIAYNWQYHDGWIGKLVQTFHEYCTRRFERQGCWSDFLGLDYYFRYKYLVSKHKREYGTQPSFGDIFPEGILHVITALHLSYPKKPLFITEFGFADSNDLRRPYWILETVRYILQARKLGVPIKGVLLWTLVNNFEWEFGMGQKFGLFEEGQLNQPLIQSEDGIAGWEAWRAAIKAIRFSTEQDLTHFQLCHERARLQYKHAGGKF